MDNRELRLVDLYECRENCKRFVSENAYLLTARSKTNALITKLQLQLVALAEENKKLRLLLEDTQAEDDRAIMD